MQNNPLLPVSEARENMLKNISSLSSEKCSIEQAHNRIIALPYAGLRRLPQHHTAPGHRRSSLPLTRGHPRKRNEPDDRLHL